jgi:hypothetical protein
MPLLRQSQHQNYTEEWMQKKVCESLALDSTIERAKAVILQEVTIPAVGRRSDIVVYFSQRKVFNIECKLANVDSVLAQALDHYRWANYSYVCMPVDAYITNWHKTQLMKKGIGLLLFIPEHGSVAEMIHARHHYPEDKELAARCMNKVLAQVELKNQTKLEL